MTVVHIQSWAECPERDIDYDGHDIHSRSRPYKNINTWEECAGKCRDNSSCNYWSWFQGGKSCWLKSSKAGRERQAGMVSGSKLCTKNLYSEEVSACLKGWNNEIFRGVTTLEDCKEKCDAATSFICKSLDYNGYSCYLSEETKKTQPSAFTEPCYDGGDDIYLERKFSGTKKCITTPSRPSLNGHPSKGEAECVFPFIYKGVKYNSCIPGNTTMSLPPHSLWCSTKVDEEGNHVTKQGEWGYCSSPCN